MACLVDFTAPRSRAITKMSEWIGTQSAMSLLGVGSSTIKRWADDGRLPSMRTAGGHRRFRRSAIDRILAGDQAESNDEIQRWCSGLRVRKMAQVRQDIDRLLKEYGDVFAAADFLSSVVAEIRRGWSDGDYSVVEKHLASEKLTQVVESVSCGLPVSENAPVCLLATITGERQNFGLSLTQLCLRYSGVDALWIGVDTPSEDLVSHVRTSTQTPNLIALYATRWQTDAVLLKRASTDIGNACRDKSVVLLLGGLGAWPDDIDYGLRCRSFTELKTAISGINFI